MNVRRLKNNPYNYIKTADSSFSNTYFNLLLEATFEDSVDTIQRRSEVALNFNIRGKFVFEVSFPIAEQEDALER